MVNKKRVVLDLDPLLYERWVNSRNIEYGSVSERLRMLIEADTELCQEDQERQEIEKSIKELDDEKRRIEKERSYLNMQLKDLDARNEKEREEQRMMAEQVRKEMQEVIVRGL